MGKIIPMKERFFNKIKLSNDGCHEWTGKISHYGYGLINEDRSQRQLRAHRVAYELKFGKIPVGLVIDHICRNRKCVNPYHLRMVTMKINSSENSVSPSAINKLKTHCSKSHEFTTDNTHIWKRKDGRTARHCKMCWRINAYNYYQKHYKKTNNENLNWKRNPRKIEC